MKSYASIDRIEGSYMVCEVELIELEESFNVDYSDRETEMMDIPLEKVLSQLGEVTNGDILVVIHNGQSITEVCGKDYDEKQRRIDYLKDLL